MLHLLQWHNQFDVAFTSRSSRPSLPPLTNMSRLGSILTVNPYIPLLTLRRGHCDTINSLAFSPSGAHLASGGDDNALVIWNVAEGRMLYRLMLQSPVDVVVWHPIHKETVIVGCEGGWLFQISNFSVVSSRFLELAFDAHSHVGLSIVRSNMNSTSVFEVPCTVWRTTAIPNSLLLAWEMRSI